MFNIKKQINVLYITSVLGNLSITGAWVAILSARGFSLVQIGFAETVFHITSLMFEIPSGVFADVYGRKKMLLISNLMTVIGNMIMAFSGGFMWVCMSIAFHALGYNFASGSGDALAYDSLKLVGQERSFEKYVSNQSIIYRIANGISTLCAGFALFIGYKPAYLISAFTSMITLLITLGLREVKTDEVSVKNESVIKMVLAYFRESFSFPRSNGRAAKLMFANSMVGAVDILLLFFLQSKLRSAGIADWTLGAALFVMELGGIAGARIIIRVEKIRYVWVFAVCTMGVAMGVMLEHTGLIPIMVIGGFLSAMADDALQIRTDARLNDMFPSWQRATLISISSFIFSVVMIILSPLAGFFFSMW